MIRFECPGCKARYTVPDDKAGKVTRCSRCRAKFYVPTGSSLAELSEPALPAPPLLPPPPSRRSPPPPEPPPFATLAEDTDVEIAPCPECDARLMVSVREVGADVECPYCNAVYRATRPKPAPSRRRPAADDDEDYDDRPRGKSRRKKAPSRASGPDAFQIAMIAVAALSAVFLLISLVVPAVAILVYVCGALVSLVGGIWFLVVAFYDDAVKGLLCLFVPFYSLFYLISNFDATKRPFYLQVEGFVVCVLSGIVLAVKMG